MEYEDVTNGEELLDYAVELKGLINDNTKLAKDAGASIKPLTKNKVLNGYLKALPTTVTDADSKVAKIIVSFCEMAKAFKEAGADYLLTDLFEEAKGIYGVDLPATSPAGEDDAVDSVNNYARDCRVVAKYRKELTGLAEDADNYDIVPKSGWSKYFDLYFKKKNGIDVSEQVSDAEADCILEKDTLDNIKTSISSLR